MMNAFLFVTALLCVSDVAAQDPAPERSEIRIKLTMLALDSSITVPDVIADSNAFVEDLRRQQRTQWSERFVLSVMENGEAKFHIGDLQAVTTGSTHAFPGGLGDEAPGRAAPTRPAGSSFRTSPDGQRAAPAPLPGRSQATFRMESTGTTVLLKPSIDQHGRLLVDMDIGSTRIDDARATVDSEKNDEELPVKWCIRKLSIQTTLSAAPGKPALLRAIETDAAGILPDQTVLILMDAQIIPLSNHAEESP